MHVHHLPERESDHKTEQVGRHEPAAHDHQHRNQKSLKQIGSCSKRQLWHYLMERIGHTRDRRNPRSRLQHQKYTQAVDDDRDHKCCLTAQHNLFLIHFCPTLFSFVFSNRVLYIRIFPKTIFNFKLFFDLRKSLHRRRMRRVLS